MNPFTLGRMRHLDLLARYFELNPGSYNDVLIAAMAAGYLVKAILASP